MLIFISSEISLNYISRLTRAACIAVSNVTENKEKDKGEKEKERNVASGRARKLILKDLSKPLLMDPVTGLQVARVLCTSLSDGPHSDVNNGESSVKS